jgi:hypothetical protein
VHIESVLANPEADLRYTGLIQLFELLHSGPVPDSSKWPDLSEAEINENPREKDLNNNRIKRVLGERISKCQSFLTARASYKLKKNNRRKYLEQILAKEYV